MNLEKLYYVQLILNKIYQIILNKRFKLLKKEVILKTGANICMIYCNLIQNKVLQQFKYLNKLKKGKQLQFLIENKDGLINKNHYKSL